MNFTHSLYAFGVHIYCLFVLNLTTDYFYQEILCSHREGKNFKRRRKDKSDEFLLLFNSFFFFLKWHWTPEVTTLPGMSFLLTVIISFKF